MTRDRLTPQGVTVDIASSALPHAPFGVRSSGFVLSREGGRSLRFTSPPTSSSSSQRYHHWAPLSRPTRA